MSDPCYSLYCKQRELERFWHSPWACGFASMVTCFRLLGDRTTEDEALIRRFRKFGENPHDGMTTDEAVHLAVKFGYRASRNPSSTKRDWSCFEQWLSHSLAAQKPVMLSVDSAGSQDEAGHWWVVYGDPDDSQLWVMDPIESGVPFECLSRREIRKFASCDDGKGWLEFDGVAISSPANSDLIAVPPSAALMDFLNDDDKHGTGWTSEEIAAALVDNHFSSVQPALARRGVPVTNVADLLDNGGAVDQIIDDWDVFFTEGQEANIRVLRRLLFDVEAHLKHKIRASHSERVTRDIALNLILIGTNLMDG